MNLLERNEEILGKIEDLSIKIWGNADNLNQEISLCMKEVNTILKEFIQRIEEFQSYGVEVPQDVILSQMRNLVEGFENRDRVLLADTLEYEIFNTILFYNDILKELEKEQV